MEDQNVIDLTSLDSSDEEGCGGVTEKDVGKEVANKEGKQKKPCIMKFTFIKRSRSSRLQIVRTGMSPKIHISCFSERSKEHFLELENESKRTYVGDSLNPFLDKALLAAERIEPGEFICLYLGKRMSWEESRARIDGNCSGDYMLYVTDGVVIDGKGVGRGAAMANHSCLPNSELEQDFLAGYDRTPIGLLRAIAPIAVGEEIETDYHLWNPVDDGMPDLNDLNSYVPCRCLRPNCRCVLKKL